MFVGDIRAARLAAGARVTVDVDVLSVACDRNVRGDAGARRAQAVGDARPARFAAVARVTALVGVLSVAWHDRARGDAGARRARAVGDARAARIAAVAHIPVLADVLRVACDSNARGGFGARRARAVGDAQAAHLDILGCPWQRSGGARRRKPGQPETGRRRGMGARRRPPGQSRGHGLEMHWGRRPGAQRRTQITRRPPAARSAYLSHGPRPVLYRAAAAGGQTPHFR